MELSDTIVMVIAMVAAIILAGLAQYRARSKPLTAFSKAVTALTNRITPESVSLEILPSTLDQMLGTATGAAVIDLVAGGDHRGFSARAVINEALIAADVPDLRRFETVPGQFIAAGLTLTFTLLSIAVWQAAEALGAATTSLVPAMQSLLTTAAIKFTVSIAAILVSIVLVHRRTQLLVDAEQALAGLAAALDSALPLVTRSDEAITMARQQAATLARIETGLLALTKPATNFAKALGEAMLPVAASINAMGDRIADTNADALERMVSAFSSELGGATLRYNQQLAEILRETSAALHDAPSQIRAAAQSTEQLLDAASDKTRMALENAATAYTNATSRLEAIAQQAGRAEEKLDGSLVQATANADATAFHLDKIAARLEAASTAIDSAASTAASADTALAQAARSATDMRTTMTADTAAWTSGMSEVDLKVAKIIDNIRNYIPATVDSTPAESLSPHKAAPDDGEKP